MSRILAVLILSLTLCSCITLSEKQAMQQDIGSMQSQLEVLRQRLESRDHEETNQNQRTLAELSASFDQMRNDLAKVNSQIDESRHVSTEGKQSTEKILQDTDVRLQDFDKRFTELEKRVEEMAKRHEETAAAVSTKKSANSSSKKKGADGEKTSPPSESEQYQQAIAPIRKQNSDKPSPDDYQAAEDRLKNFLKAHPKTKMKPNVYYWMGEIYYGKSEYKRAILEFEKVVESDAKHEKAPAARLKQGLCFLALKEPDKAKLFLQQVVDQYPKTSEAHTAKKKLGEIK